MTITITTSPAEEQLLRQADDDDYYDDDDDDDEVEEQLERQRKQQTEELVRQNLQLALQMVELDRQTEELKRKRALIDADLAWRIQLRDNIDEARRPDAAAFLESPRAERQRRILATALARRICIYGASKG